MNRSFFVLLVFLSATAFAQTLIPGSGCYDGVNTSTVVPNGPAVDFPNHCEVDAGVSFTIDFWVKTPLATGTYAILDKREASGQSLRGWHVFVSYGRLGFQQAGGTGAFVCSPSPGAAPCTNFASPFFIADDQWHFVAITIDQGCRVNTGTFYVDGLISTFPVDGRNMGNSADLYIGQRMPNLGGEHWLGCIADLAVTAGGVSKQVLDSIYASGPNPSPFASGACPIVNACIGECGKTIVTQAVITTPITGLQLNATDGSLCPNEAVQLTIESGANKSTQTFTMSNGPVTTLFAWPLAPPDVVRVSAALVAGDQTIVCKREGQFAFTLTPTP